MADRPVGERGTRNKQARVSTATQMGDILSTIMWQREQRFAMMV
jgi:hypothetical protein